MDVQERGKALEDAFFAAKNRELLAQLKEDLDAEGQHAALEAATGFTDEKLVDQLLALGITAESLAALSLAPMVLVAWADGKLDPKERDAIIQGAQEHGISASSTAGKLLQSWLGEPPEASLEQVWTDYIHAIKAQLPAGEQAKLSDQMLGRCQQVAEAAGGFLGLGSISATELNMLEKLQAAFR